MELPSMQKMDPEYIIKVVIPYLYPVFLQL